MTLTSPSTAPGVESAQRATYWPVPIARAVPTAGLALVITFSSDHSASFGLVVFGVFGIVSGIVSGVGAWLRLAGSRVRAFLVAQAMVTVVAGLVALLLTGANSSGSEVRFLFFTITIFAAVTGFLELYSGLRSRRRFVASGDWMVMGTITVALALAFILIPLDYRQNYSGPDQVKRVLDASVVAVGVLGAWAAIATLFLVIAGLSAKWGTQSAGAATARHVTPMAAPGADAPNTPRKPPAESENRG
ncbi:MAG: hypothetical protein V4531_06050 [Actinomycetota bacterium]